MLLTKSSILTAAVISGATLSDPVFAQEDPGHPRVNQVQERIENQEKRIGQGNDKGQLTSGEAAHDIKRDAKIERQLRRGEAKHGGHITKAEQRKLNRELNRNSRAIHDQRHPH
jgi:hypothetical protein